MKAVLLGNGGRKWIKLGRQWPEQKGNVLINLTVKTHWGTQTLDTMHINRYINKEAKIHLFTFFSRPDIYKLIVNIEVEVNYY